MSAAFATPHPLSTISNSAPEAISSKRTSKPGAVATFIGDLIEDVAQRPLQAAEFAKHDMFKEHINAMSISYFALIVVLIGASIPMLGYLVRTLVPY